MKKIERFMEVGIYLVLSILFLACGVHNIIFGHTSTFIWSLVLAAGFMYEFIVEKNKLVN
jgi:hypothetical protein